MFNEEITEIPANRWNRIKFLGGGGRKRLLQYCAEQEK